MQSLLSDLWSHILPVALALCATLILFSLLAESFVTARRKNIARTPPNSIFSLSFALPLAPILLLLALWLSPQTIATTATLLARQSPESLRLLFLAAPLALFFLWCEGSSVAKINEKASKKMENTTSPTTPLEHLALRVFGEPSASSLAYRTARAFVVLFALCCLVSLLFDLVPTLAHLFWNQAARITRLVRLPIASNTFVSTLGVGLILTLLLPQLFSQPNKVIARMLLLLLPCALLFYGALCLVAALHTNVSLNVSSLPVATGSAFNADTMLATLGVFRPAFGWLALLCCVPYVTSRATPDSVPTSIKLTRTSRRAKALSVFSLLLAFACLLGFVGLTAAPIVFSKAWLLGEQGLNPLRSAFLSSYPQDGWLIEASLAALSATTLLALSALTGAALTLLHKKAEARTLLLILLAVMLGMLSSGSKGGGEAWQTNLLFVLQHTQKIGQMAQGIATLLFIAALSALALRSLRTLRR